MNQNLFKEINRHLRHVLTITMILFLAISITACTEEKKVKVLFDSAELDIEKINHQRLTYSEIYLYSKKSIEKIDDMVHKFPEAQLAKELHTNERLIAGKTLAQIKHLNELSNIEKDKESDLFYLATKINASFESKENINELIIRKTRYANSLHDFDKIEKAKITLAEAEVLAGYLLDSKDKLKAYTYIANAYINIGENIKATYIADKKIKRLDESSYRPLSEYLRVKTCVATSLFHKNPAQAKKILLDLSNEIDDFNSKVDISSIFNAYIYIGDKDGALEIAKKNYGIKLYSKLIKLTSAYIADDNLDKANNLVSRHEDGEDKALAMIELSNYYIEKGDYNKAVELLLKSYNLAENIKVNKYKDTLEHYNAIRKAKLMNKIAGHFLRAEERLRASQVFDRALEVAKGYTPIVSSEILALAGAEYYKSGYVEKGNSLLREAFIDAKLETQYKGSATHKVVFINLELLRFEEALAILQDRSVPVDNRANVFIFLAEKAAENNRLDIVSNVLSELLQSYNISSIHSSVLAKHFFRVAKIVKDKNIELTDEQKKIVSYLLIEYYPLEKLLSDNAALTH